MEIVLLIAITFTLIAAKVNCSELDTINRVLYPLWVECVYRFFNEIIYISRRSNISKWVI